MILSNLIFALLFAIPQANSFNANVVYVKDGDSFIVKHNNKNIEVRLASIDAIELGQELGYECKADLAQKILRKNIQITPITRDKYNRIIANVTIGNININRAQVRNGCALAYRRYLYDRNILNDEKLAKQEGKNYWALNKKIPPWNYRNEHKN